MAGEPTPKLLAAFSSTLCRKEGPLLLGGQGGVTDEPVPEGAEGKVRPKRNGTHDLLNHDQDGQSQ